MEIPMPIDLPIVSYSDLILTVECKDCSGMILTAVERFIHADDADEIAVLEKLGHRVVTKPRGINRMMPCCVCTHSSTDTPAKSNFAPTHTPTRPVLSLKGRSSTLHLGG